MQSIKCEVQNILSKSNVIYVVRKCFSGQMKIVTHEQHLVFVNCCVTWVKCLIFRRYTRDAKMGAVSVLYSLQYEVSKYRRWRQVKNYRKLGMKFKINRTINWLVLEKKKTEKVLAFNKVYKSATCIHVQAIWCSSKLLRSTWIHA